jgi:hypothetical protein
LSESACSQSASGDVGDDDQKSTVVGDIGGPNGHGGDEVIWPANVADEPIKSEPHRRLRASSHPSWDQQSFGRQNFDLEKKIYQANFVSLWRIPESLKSKKFLVVLGHVISSAKAFFHLTLFR